ncbi:Pre-mRNA splicing factor PRP21 like protein-domain-containing protein [Xylogone sp. PMI_703]|nr:Pre-mRNA splicing factor PRP21 like protein-domain-containing protein [Xylogone sp. PMI_703]
MAPAATETEAIASLEEIKPPAGVVLPPKEIKAILEKTAGYVARNGFVFEDRIREKERHNPKFSFLSPNDAYNAYYQWRLDEIREGRGTAVAAGRVGEEVVETKPEGPPEPPEYQFCARMPNINAQDLEVVRLTALFVAKNGRQFMTALSQREAGNYQFDFFRPNHSLHNFFQRMVDQYTTLLRAGGIDGEGGKAQQERINELQENINNKFHVLERAKQRAEWSKYQDQQKQKKQEEVEKDKLAYASIDWHDFVVVETVIFTEADDQMALPPPTSLSELQFASLEQKAMMSINPNRRIEEAMPGEETYYNSSSYPQQQQAPHVVPIPVAPTSQPAYQPSYQETRARDAEAEEEERRIRERTEARERAQQAQAQAKGNVGPMKVKENYVPRAAARAAQKTQMALCPNCKQQIPYNELDEHMRIELLDPRWKEQKAKADSRYATTNLSTQDVANNLKRLASQRNDLFDGVAGQGLSEEEEARRKKAAMMDPADRARVEPIQSGQSLSVEDQIRAIHEKFGDRR